MLKATFALLLVLAALSGGIYALNGSKKGQKRHKTEDPSRVLRRYEPYFSSPPSAARATSVADSLSISPRVIAVFMAALVLGTAAYLGLGQTLEANAVPTTTTPAMATNDVSLHDDLRPEVWHSEGELSKLVVNAQLAAQPPTVTDSEPVLVAPPAEEAAPAPAAELAPAPAAPAFDASTLAPGSIEAIICALPWPCAEAIGVASCESGLDRNGHLDGNWAYNGNHFGLFQISGIHAWRWADFWDAWMDPARNAQFAYDIWSESGWRPWSCRPY